MQSFFKNEITESLREEKRIWLEKGVKKIY